MGKRNMVWQGGSGFWAACVISFYTCWTCRYGFPMANRKNKKMESLYILLGTCMFIFVLFSFYEVVRLRKEVNKLTGIVNYLLKDHPEKK